MSVCVQSTVLQYEQLKVGSHCVVTSCAFNMWLSLLRISDCLDFADIEQFMLVFDLVHVYDFVCIYLSEFSCISCSVTLISIKLHWI